MTKENLKQNAERLYRETLGRIVDLVGESFEGVAEDFGKRLDPVAMCEEHSGADYSVEELQLMRVYKLVTQIAAADALDLWRDVAKRVEMNQERLARESVGSLIERIYVNVESKEALQ